MYMSFQESRSVKRIKLDIKEEPIDESYKMDTTEVQVVTVKVEKDVAEDQEDENAKVMPAAVPIVTPVTKPVTPVTTPTRGRGGGRGRGGRGVARRGTRR